MERKRSVASKMLVRLKHIYIFLLHVLNEAFQLKAFFEDVMRLYSLGWWRLGVDFVFMKKGMWLYVTFFSLYYTFTPLSPNPFSPLPNHLTPRTYD